MAITLESENQLEIKVKAFICLGVGLFLYPMENETDRRF
jgi:hypothetical protein